MPEKIGRFVLGRCLGEGAFGKVYQAHDPQLDRDVALKVAKLDRGDAEQRVKRFLREAKAAANLRHPHIVPLYEFGQDSEQFFIASAFIQGQTLKDALELASGGREPPEAAPQGAHAPRSPENARPPLAGDLRRAVRIVRALAEALGYAHGLGIVHRDVKPANTMLDEKDEPLVMDFGLAARQEEAEQLTHAGQVLGTPLYMAPEQARGKTGQALPASDQYALGVMLFELLTGRPPFEGTVELVMFHHQETEPPSPRKVNPAVPRDLETICLMCLEKDPAKRYDSCQDLADDLRRWLDGEPVSARPIGTLERMQRWTRKNPLSAALLGTVAVTVLLGATIAGYFAWQSNQNAELYREEAITAKKNETDAITAKNGLQKTTNELKKMTGQLQTSVARSLLTPLALNVRTPTAGPLTDPEIEALWELASYQGTDLGIRFVADALRTVVTTRQLKHRAEHALHTAVGLNQENRQRVEDLLRSRMESVGLEESQRIDLALALAALGDCAPATNTLSARWLTQALSNTIDPSALQTLTQGLSSVAARMEPKEAAATLTQALTKTTDPSQLRFLAQGLSSVAARMEPKEAAATLTQALTKTTDSEALLSLAQGLSSVAAKMEPREASQVCKEAAATLTKALSNTKDPEALRILAQELSSVAARMEPKEASQVCKEAAATLTKALSNTTNPYALSSLAQGLSSVAARMEPKEASQVCKEAATTLTKALSDPKNSYALSSLTQGLSSVAARMEPKEASQVCKEAAATLTKALSNTKDPEALKSPSTRGKPRSTVDLSNTKDPEALPYLAQGLSSVAARMEPKEASVVCNEAAATLTKALSNTKDPYALSSLTQGLSSVAARMEPKEAAEAAATLVQVMSNTTNPYALSSLAQGLSSVAARMEPKEASQVCKEAAATLVQALSNTKDPSQLRSLTQGLSSVAARMEPKEASQVCKEAAATLTKAMTKTTSPYELQFLAQGLSSVAARMEPKEASVVCNEAAATLTKALSNTKDPSALQFLAQGLSSVAARMEPKEAAATLVQALSNTKDPSQLRSLKHRRAAVLIGEDDSRLAQRRDAVVGTISGLIGAGSWLTAPALLQPALEPLPPPLPAQTLVDLLKQPLFVGEARRLVLDQLERHYQRPFADQWDFVRFAREHNLPLDLTSPPQRPTSP